METNEIKITDNGRSGSTWYFEFESQGFIGNFRIHFLDNTRKNGNVALKALNVYFDGFKDSVFSNEVMIVTDAMIFVERKMQWILEYLLRESNRR